jgi:arabinose-5-phosphate isomerase
VVENNRLLGVISDGDLRRLLEKRKDVLSMTAGDCLIANPKTIYPDEFAMTALHIMEQKKITSLVVTSTDGTVVGIIHLHDLWGTQMV